MPAPPASDRRPERRLLGYGERGVLVECPDLDQALGLMAALEQRPLEPVREIVPGARTLLLRLRRPLSAHEEHDLLTRPGTAPTRATADELEIAVRYDGEDLDDVARLTGLTTTEVVRAHTGQRWTVGFCGFAPGFGYLSSDGGAPAVPRRTVPRTRVPAGAVALADVWTGIYPRSGPGGWQLIGSTSAPVWDLDRDPPALLRPGVVVRFVARRGASC